jgi:hypothetical protein
MANYLRGRDIYDNERCVSAPWPKLRHVTGRPERRKSVATLSSGWSLAVLQM